MTPSSTAPRAPRDCQSDLFDALSAGVLSGPLAQQGQAILDQMRKPLRLSVLGLPGTGKSTLMNLLLGAPVLPIDAPLPTISIAQGEQSVARCTLADGTIRKVSTEDLTAAADLSPIFIEATMSLPALAKLSLMEVVAGATAAEQKRALSWAAKRTDLAVWCTEGFTAQEFGLWDLIPEHVQDHSFMLLSKADLWAANGSLTARLTEAEDAAGDRFRQILPLHGQGAIAATLADGSVDKEALRRSGGIALISAILREVEQGKRAAADKADIFLRQIDYDPDARSEPVSQTVQTAQAPAPASAPTPAPEPVAEIHVSPAANTPDTPREISDVAREACTLGAAQLEAEGAALRAEMEAGRLTPDAVLEVSVDTISWLAEYLGDSGAANDPVLQDARATANDAADLVQLIQLETGENVAIDAVSLMVQLKQELLARVAA